MFDGSAQNGTTTLTTHTNTPARVRPGGACATILSRAKSPHHRAYRANGITNHVIPFVLPRINRAKYATFVSFRSCRPQATSQQAAGSSFRSKSTPFSILSSQSTVEPSRSGPARASLSTEEQLLIDNREPSEVFMLQFQRTKCFYSECLSLWNNQTIIIYCFNCIVRPGSK